MNRNKGNSLLGKFNSFTVIDLETTGYDPRFDEIIELAAIKVKDGIVVSEYQSLIKPSLKIDSFISDLTGITNEMVKTAPALKDKIKEFMDYLESDIIIGHNVNFDINFLHDSALSILGQEFQNDFIDTLRFSRRVHPELEHHRLKDLKELYKITTSAEHRGVPDCYATLELYYKLIEDSTGKNIDLEKISKSHLRAKDILSLTEPDPDSPIYNKNIVFTGTLERMVRKEAMQIVANLGGINGDSVTKKTNFLVLGNNDYSCALKDGKSSKHKKAEELINKGADLQIISEDAFFDMIEQ